MALTRSLFEAKVQEYREAEPLYAIEQEHVEMLPRTFRGEEYGWRDVEWVVQWYFRRHLAAYPDAERRATEESFRENDLEDVVDALSAVVAQRSVAERLDRLTTLTGVDVPVASALLTFAFPDRCVAIGDREWRALVEVDELGRSYPAAPSVEDYRTYHELCRDLAGRFDADAWTLYRALWRIGDET